MQTPLALRKSLILGNRLNVLTYTLSRSVITNEYLYGKIGIQN